MLTATPSRLKIYGERMSFKFCKVVLLSILRLYPMAQPLWCCHQVSLATMNSVLSPIRTIITATSLCKIIHC